MSDEQLHSLGERLRELREQAGLSIRQLALRVGVHHSYLAYLEHGEREKVSADILQKIAEVLDADASELFEFIGIKPASTLPSTRMFFRRKFGVSASDAEILANLVEHQLNKQQEVHHEETDEERHAGSR
jgi:transcriptional regulator with XRE-family HTH domain